MHTVILVDDEVYVRKGLRSVVNWNQFGYEVIDEADNGEDALEMIGRRKPDVVITDIRMPVLDGLELIERSQKQNPKTSFIILSGYGDFRYAQQAVRYGIHDFLLKPVDEEELADTLSRLHPKLLQNKLLDQTNRDWIRESIMDALLRGEADSKLMSGWAEALGVGEAEPVHYAFIEVNDLHPWNGRKLPPMEELKERMKEVVLASMPVRESEKAFLQEHLGRFGLLISAERRHFPDGSIESYARRLQRELAERLEAVVYIYVGKPAKSLLQLKESYLSAKDALQYKFAREGETVILYSRIEGTAVHSCPVIDDSFFRKLVERTEEQNQTEILHLVHELFQAFRSQGFAPEAVKSALSHAVNAVLASIHSMEGEERELTKLDAMLHWQDVPVSPGELKRLFTEFLLESAAYIAKLRKEQAQGSIRKVKQYMETHYHENLSLKSIASIFYMNPVYLGQLFKKTYGMYFNEYLLKLRINEAKKLLRQTDFRVYEISEKVGFNNADYFVSQFQKLERLTPTEYRNKLLGSR